MKVKAAKALGISALLALQLLVPAQGFGQEARQGSLETGNSNVPATTTSTVYGSGSIGTLAAVPSPWSNKDIGSPSLAGSADFNAGTGVYTVKGAGKDIWGTSDQFHYVYQPLTGSGAIIAQVTGQGNTDDFAKAGLMIRETLDANAKHVDIAAVPSGMYTFQYRNDVGGATTSVKANSTSPSWLKLERDGNTFKGSYSTDGSTWTEVSQTSVTMESSVYVGLAVSSHSVSKLSTATFTNVSLGGSDTTAPSVPTGLTSPGQTETTVDLSWAASTDNVGVTGYDVFQNGTLIGSPLSTSYSVVGLTPGTAYSFTVKAKDAAGNSSAASSQLSVTTKADTTAPTEPTNVTAASKTDTTVTLTWTASTDNVGVTAYDIYRDGTLVQAGVTETSYTVTGLTASTAYSFTVKAKDAAGNQSAASQPLSVTTNAPGPGEVPAPWQSKDIGSPAVAGSALYDANTDVFTVSGAGKDIWSTSDQFRYVYRPWSGDGTIVALITSQTNTDGWAKAGIMIRENLNADAKHADLLLSPSNGFTFQYRTVAGGSTESVKQASSSPAWVKLQRTGNVIKGFVSNNGMNWGDIGSVTVAMGANVYFGLAVTSHDVNTASTATISKVTANASGDVYPPTAPTNVAVDSKTDTSVGLSWLASVDDIGVTGYDVYRDGQLAGSTTTETSFKVTGLKANTAYSFTVKAKDAAGHVSEASTPLSVTTAAQPDTQSPTAPSNLSSPAKTSSSVSLAWTASTDNVGVFKYDVYKDGKLADSTTGTTFTVSGLTANTTYSFAVKARDLAGNVSAASNTLSVKTSSTSTDPYTLQVVADNLEVPWALAFAPDGRIFFTERNSGRVRVVVNGQVRSTPVITLGAPFYYQPKSEGGLLGIALDPNFETNHYMYLYHTYKDSNNTVKNRLVRLIEKNNTATLDKVLLDKLPGAVYHNGGRLKVGPDNKLYFSNGNYGKTDDTLTYLGGKIFRLNLDGTIPSDNPFGASSPVYTRGHRNPQGLAWQPGTNRLFASEHGEAAKDEINLIVPGANYGWPDYEGDNQNKPGITPPLIHSGNARWAPSGITFVSDGPWKGDLLVSNLAGKQIIRMQVKEQNGQPVIGNLSYLYKNTYGRIREIIEAPDRSLYLITSNNGDKNGDGTPDKLIRLIPNF
ncbi:PQQ-dependent sugar dehydrogenase [Paenibacillus elgii]|uniref:PQQ-dependent sugar dehydrogenase n=1 Tax=Paenibacillus elgii TaxID=189691 RepID=UPI00203CC256|nr:PQQ-dependent sugar dehydrogenase [Paenibacillus elgii]MCM3269616.1 PQQ-dependent sugar dehydrogenase [Paenibacillus elgii]